MIKIEVRVLQNISKLQLFCFLTDQINGILLLVIFEKGKLKVKKDELTESSLRLKKNDSYFVVLTMVHNEASCFL